MVEQAWRLLWAQNSALACAGLLLLAARPLLARVLGVRAAYGAWLALPCALAGVGMACAWPWLGSPLAVASRVGLASQVVPAAWPVRSQLDVGTGPHGLSGALLVAWACGVLMMGGLARRRHRQFLLALSRGGCPGDGPAVLGLLRPRLWLPADFAQRHDAFERQAILAHEAVHARRRDNLWNLLGYALLCVHWFNPVAWLAWRRMRRDQELSCDAIALAACGHSQPVYVRALLKAHGVAPPTPAVTGWVSPEHPLVERIRMLKTPSRLAHSNAVARAVMLVGALLATGLGHALQAMPVANGALVAPVTPLAPAAPLATPAPLAPRSTSPLATPAAPAAVQRGYLTGIVLAVDGRTVSSPSLLGQAGQALALHVDADGSAGLPWPIDLGLVVSPQPQQTGSVRVALSLVLAGAAAPAASPQLVMKLGEPAHVRVATPDGAHRVEIALTTRPRG